MSQIHYQPIELEELVQFADYILVVKKSTPFTTTGELKIPLEIGNTEEYSPFYYTVYHFEVVKVLFGEDKKSVPGTIEVLSSNIGIMYENYKMYYLDGILESPICSSYETQVDIDNEETVIIFLYKDKKKGVYELQVENAWESITKIDSIVKLIKKLRK